MTDYLKVDGGIVTAILHDPVSADDQRSRLAATQAEAAELSSAGVKAAAPDAQTVRAMVRGLDVDATVMQSARLHYLEIAIAQVEAALAQSPTLLPAEIFSESTIGAAPAWPRAYRSGLLAATDHTEMPGWRASKSADVLKAADDYRQALRDLPAAQPDAAAVKFPTKPATI